MVIKGTSIVESDR